MNMSHLINPYNYGNRETVEVITLECAACNERKTKRLHHATSNTEIMTKHFPGWKAKGYRNQKRTLCPSCANDELSHRRPKRSASPEDAIGGCEQ